MDATERAALRYFRSQGASPERAMAQMQGFTDADFERAFGRPIDDGQERLSHDTERSTK